MMVLLRSFAGQGVIVRIADAPDRLLDAGLGQAFGIADGQILRPAVTVVDQGIARVHHAGVQGLLERVKRQTSAKRVRHPPAHDAPGIGIDDERDVNEPRPGRDIRLARKSHQLSAADTDPCTVTGRTPASRFDSANALVSATPSAPFGPCGPPQHCLGALATKVGEISELVREPQGIGAQGLEHPVDPVRRARKRRHCGRLATGRRMPSRPHSEQGRPEVQQMPRAESIAA